MPHLTKRTLLETIHDEQRGIRRLLVALTENEQKAVNNLSSALDTLARNLATVLEAAQTTRDELAAMATEEGREQAERERLEALVAGMETDVIDALTPLTEKAQQMDVSLKSPTSTQHPLTMTAQ